VSSQLLLKTEIAFTTVWTYPNRCCAWFAIGTAKDVPNEAVNLLKTKDRRNESHQVVENKQSFWKKPFLSIENKAEGGHRGSIAKRKRERGHRVSRKHSAASVAATEGDSKFRIPNNDREDLSQKIFAGREEVNLVTRGLMPSPAVVYWHLEQVQNARSESKQHAAKNDV